MRKEKHEHQFEPYSRVVPLHNYVTENGKLVKDLITGKDTLKQLKCACGAIQTLDLKRSTKSAPNPNKKV